MDEREVEAALALEAAWVGALRAAWLRLIDLATWGDVRSARLGGSGRLRKRVLETGERLKSLAGPREQPLPRGECHGSSLRHAGPTPAQARAQDLGQLPP